MTSASRIIRQLWLPIGLTVGIVALIARVPPITNSSGGPAPALTRLVLPTSYVIFSPFSRLLDALTLLSNPQSIALFASVAFLLVIWLVISQKDAKRPLWRRGAVSIALLILGIAVVEAATVFLPRQMAAIVSSDPDVVRVDFHSHTGTSHDVRKSFSAEDNRDWHRSGGFDIAYITDHVKFAGAVSAAATNPVKAGEGTSLLSGVEGRYHRIISTIVLGIDHRDSVALNRRGNLTANVSPPEPITMIALPSRNLDSLNAGLHDSVVALPNLRAIELVDAAPRGLSQLDRQERKIRETASRLNLILVSASNHHGFGRAVAAWNLMRVPGWRSLPPDSVGRLIEQQIRNRSPGSVEIVRRTRPGVHGVAVAATLPILFYQVVGSLTPVERVAWLIWIWGLAALGMTRTRSWNARRE